MYFTVAVVRMPAAGRRSERKSHQFCTYPLAFPASLRDTPSHPQAPKASSKAAACRRGHSVPHTSKTHEPGIDRAFGATVPCSEILWRHASVERPQQIGVFFTGP